MSNTVRLNSGCNAEELHKQLINMAKEVQVSDKTVSTKLQVSKWNGKLWRILTNFLAKIGIKLERTNASHVAEKLNTFVSKNNTFFNDDYYADNFKNLKKIFEKVLSIDSDSGKNLKNQKYTKIFDKCIDCITKKVSQDEKPKEPTGNAGQKVGEDEKGDSSASLRSEDGSQDLSDFELEESEDESDDSTTSLRSEDGSQDLSDFELEESEDESDHSPTSLRSEDGSQEGSNLKTEGAEKNFFAAKYSDALQHLNVKGYASENVKEFLLVLYDGQKDISECAEELRGISGLTAQLAETVEKLALNITKNERYRTDEEVEISHKTRLRHIMTILSVLPFDEHVEKIIGNVKQYPSVLLQGISASLEVGSKSLTVRDQSLEKSSKSFFMNLKKELKGEDFKGYWEIILNLQPQVSEDWHIERGAHVWNTSIAGDVVGSSVKQRQTALHLFAKQEFSDYAQQLAEKLLSQAPYLLNFIEGIRKHSPLAEAVNANNEEMVAWLLSKNPDLKCINDERKNALKIAIANGNTKLIGMLIKADPSRESWIDAGLIKSLESNEMAEDVIRRFN
ncbi:ankyrin repeat domain-containing protein [Parachlamydia acanthamoebae]|uniref:Uncharacterized protein n=2 Tax=Parachlamydia TaxID=83551 RepID=A0A0C1C7N6_9BACT|nr:ankyrin repeat domain-containing protein [Parachlamydia acanthamoebae]KIA77065.1 hypothetical protein DB43_GV00150 [Parachlamydia acanthamoebae]